MIDQTVIDNLRQIDCREIAQRLPLSLSGKGSELAGPCPKCQGSDRFIVKAESFFCRTGEGHCGAKGNGIGLVQLVTGKNFPDACKHLAELMNMPITEAPATPARTKATKAQALDWKGEAWQNLATTYAANASRRLAQVAMGSDYLASRGITEATAEAFGVGFDASAHYSTGVKSPALVIPWWDGDLITCIQWRFINPPSSQRYNRAKFPHIPEGSTGEPVLFLPPQRRSKTLVIVEGEINALSIYQVSSYDPVSIGSHALTQKTLAALEKMAPKYDRVLVWTDEPKIAQQIGSAINHIGAKLFVSPEWGGKKLDANAMLQGGILAGMLTQLIGHETAADLAGI